MVELRKRKTPPPAPVRPAKTQKKAAPKTKLDKVKDAVKEKVEAVKEFSGKSNGEPSGKAVVPAAGGEVETHEGTKTTLAKLVEESKSGVVLFTYPKASTPGCKCAHGTRRVRATLTGVFHRHQASMPLP